ncbi:MAG: K(+)-transporting ATPase subunit F [Fimbriimonadaceae bacterium]|nr:K(+)-transporting ATPase subunit F [Fimbriimonadaceae bacterium]
MPFSFSRLPQASYASASASAGRQMSEPLVMGLLSLALLGYLTYALLKPERF